MKKTIYKYFFYEFLRYFVITLFALAMVVWTIQAVNYLDLITDDGHAFTVYFYYSVLSLSKVFTKLFPFCFLVAAVLTIIKLEKDNELMIFWTSGLNKIHIVNLLLRISLVIMLLQLFLTIVVNPTLLNFSRSLLKNSELQFLPSLLKEKQFNDTVEKLTIFLGKKNENKIYENIFIQDDGKILSNVGGKSSTIFAKSGQLNNNEKNLILYNGSIQRLEENGIVNVFKFDKTTLNLAGISTKSITEPKMQETPTLKILACIKNNYASVDMHNCNRTKKSFMDTKIELNKRFGTPIYIPLIALICSFLLVSRKDKKIYNYKKYISFFVSFIILVIAEIIVRYSGISWTHTGIYYLVPICLLPLIYLMLNKTFKYENLS